MSLRESFAEAVGGVPTADPDRCVHGHAEVASCQRCVSGCPQAAWVLDDEALAIDTDRCDGCGLCVADCPEGALSQAGTSPAAYAGQSTLTLSCGRTASHADGWRMPCVNAVGLHQIAFLYRAGLRRLMLQTAGCSDCPKAGGRGLLHRAALLNRVLAQRGLPVLAVDLSPADPAGAVAATPPERAGPSLSRRGFFRRMAGAVAEHRWDGEDHSWRPAGEYLPPAGPGDLVLFAPRIDPGRCNGCDACIRICPHGALVLEQGEDAYRVRPEACTGCGLCTDVCDQDAVSVSEGAPFEFSFVKLERGRCRACGADFHRPSGAPGAPSLCHVCARVNHRRSLYQVL